MRAIYAFSGDPMTYGHIDIVQRAARTYSEVVVAISDNPQKKGKYLFTTQERLSLAKHCIETIHRASCTQFTGLLGEYAYRNGFDVIIRGVRNSSDLEDELVLYGVNEQLHASVDTVFFPTRLHLSHIGSSVVKAIVAEGGNVSRYCQLCVKSALEKRILDRFFVGIAGGIASGKTYLSKRLLVELRKKGKAVYVNLDKVGHSILGTASEAIYVHTRDRICENFGVNLRNRNGSINRKALGKLVFRNSAAFTELNRIMEEPMMARFYEEIQDIKGGIVLVEGAILIEMQWTNLVNNNVILVDAPETVRVEREMRRLGISKKEALERVQRQCRPSERKALIKSRIHEYNWGRLWEVNTPKEEDIVSVANTLYQEANQSFLD